MGQRILSNQASAPAKPAQVRNDRRSGLRVPLRLGVRIKVNDGGVKDALIRDVNLRGLALEPADGVSIRDRVNVGFDGYPEVAPAFALTGWVRRILTEQSPEGEIKAMGIEIDRDVTSSDALSNYRRLVLHYVRHRPLLDGINKGYFEGRCKSCEWIGRVGRRSPVCSRCGSEVVPL
jgi:hypothetical protein